MHLPAPVFENKIQDNQENGQNGDNDKDCGLVFKQTEGDPGIVDQGEMESPPDYGDGLSEFKIAAEEEFGGLIEYNHRRAYQEGKKKITSKPTEVFHFIFFRGLAGTSGSCGHRVWP